MWEQMSLLFGGRWDLWGTQVVLMDENVTRLREEWYLWEQMACIWDRNGLWVIQCPICGSKCHRAECHVVYEGGNGRHSEAKGHFWEKMSYFEGEKVIYLWASWCFWEKMPPFAGQKWYFWLKVPHIGEESGVSEGKCHLFGIQTVFLKSNAPKSESKYHNEECRVVYLGGGGRYF